MKLKKEQEMWKIVVKRNMTPIFLASVFDPSDFIWFQWRFILWL